MATKTTRTDTTETSVTEATAEKGARRRGPSLNRVSLIGRVATDPVLRYTPNGVAVTNFRLANNGTYAVQFHRICRVARTRRNCDQVGSPGTELEFAL